MCNRDYKHFSPHYVHFTPISPITSMHPKQDSTEAQSNRPVNIRKIQPAANGRILLPPPSRRINRERVTKTRPSRVRPGRVRGRPERKVKIESFGSSLASSSSMCAGDVILVRSFGRSVVTVILVGLRSCGRSFYADFQRHSRGNGDAAERHR